MHIYMATNSNIHLYIQPKSAQEVHKTFSQCIYTQAAGVHYNKLTQLRFRATQIPCGGL